MGICDIYSCIHEKGKKTLASFYFYFFESGGLNITYALFPLYAMYR